MQPQRDRAYYWAILALIATYLTVRLGFNVSVATEIVSTIISLIAAVALWLEFRRDKRLNAAKFLLELNDQFIGNPEMTAVEHALEQYYDAVKNSRQPILNLNLNIDSPDRQRLINYLVHLEGIATLVNNRVLDIDHIDDLLAYRFFIAVNNPLVQNSELKEYDAYYSGIYSLSKKWSLLWEKKHKPIPLVEYSLWKVQKSLSNY